MTEEELYCSCSPEKKWTKLETIYQRSVDSCYPQLLNPTRSTFSSTDALEKPIMRRQTELFGTYIERGALVSNTVDSQQLPLWCVQSRPPSRTIELCHMKTCYLACKQAKHVNRGRIAGAFANSKWSNQHIETARAHHPSRWAAHDPKRQPPNCWHEWKLSNLS